MMQTQVVRAVAAAFVALMLCCVAGCDQGGPVDLPDGDATTDVDDVRPLDAPAPETDVSRDGIDIDPDSTTPDTVSDTPAPDDGTGDAATDIQAADADAGALDAATDVFEEVQADIPICWEEPLQCTETVPFDYVCTADNPDSCPGGMCVLGTCIGPVLNEDRWIDCGNDCCTPCEDATDCPADCGKPPVFTGSKDYDNDTTITVWVHGWSNTKPEEATYGQERGCGGLLEDMSQFGIVRPCSREDGTELSPQQIAKFEYFGDKPATWLTAEQVAEIEKFKLGGADTLHRYALITAMYIRHKLDLTGATHVNLACHSYGCLISRYMMEHNLKGLAGENRFVRWFTSAGVLAGARLARLYDNPGVKDVADAIGMSQGDFIVMNPDFLKDYVAVWDHDIYAANSPYLGRMIVHHTCGDDPRIKQALNIALLDLNNPGDEPNDGIMYTLDTYFHEQDTGNRFLAKNGERLLPSHSYVYVDHMAVPETESSIALATANLFHKRKVIVTLKEVQLINDLESPLLLDKPPAEIIVEHQVRYSPYLPDTFGKNPLISENVYEYRTPEMFTMTQGQTRPMNQVIYSGPIFDAMESLWLKVELLEVDWYPRFDVNELAAGIGDKHEALITFEGDVPLNDHTFTATSANVKMQIEVDVVELY